eukprot:TRINITY_DN6509_c1_g1_i1.p1 TRINITY_DN6509_c1_g1~~TRINITY_DN6509_c1_g1_i1.p1  ORF type:complete len:259 (-),score=41.98 TRINITY_DN6509_c1_g1_i1:266-1042(-)
MPGEDKTTIQVEESTPSAGELLAGLAGILSAVNAATDAAISEEDRRASDLHYQIGDALFSQENDSQGAISEFCTALSRNPSNVDAFCGIATVLAEQGDLDGAGKALRRALAIEPRHGLSHYLLGTVCGRRGDFDGAVLEFKAVIEYQPGSQIATLAQQNLEAAARVTEEHPLTYETGLTAEDIAQIEVFRWEDESLQHPEVKEQIVCTICIKDFSRSEEVRKLRCGHLFHKTCVDEWLRRCSDCPLCKKRAVEQSFAS